MPRLTRSCAFFFTAMALSLTGLGCSPGTGEVSGKVTYNGAPLDKPNGNIVFVTPSGIQKSAPISADGTYRATDVPRGDVKVAVYYSNPKFQEVMKQPRKLPGANETATPSPLATTQPYLTPDKYASGDTSGFAVSVGATTTFNAELTGPPLK
jgi:hypothetical protein